jgi:hypothetical protein
VQVEALVAMEAVALVAALVVQVEAVEAED